MVYRGYNNMVFNWLLVMESLVMTLGTMVLFCTSHMQWLMMICYNLSMSSRVMWVLNMFD